MEEKWLRRRWMEVTENRGLYEYSEPDDPVALFTSLTGGSVWRAAAKSTLFFTRMGGLIGSTAKQSHDFLLNGNSMELEMLVSHVDWPQWVEDLYKSYATPAKSNSPPFISPFSLYSFIRDVVYEKASEPEMESA